MKIKAVFLLSLICLSQHFNFVRITVKLVWCFENDWKSFKFGVVYDLYHCFKAKTALADFFVSVRMAAHGVFAVVEVDGFQPFQPDDAVEFRQYIIQMFHNVISSVENMAGVHANP